MDLFKISTTLKFLYYFKWHLMQIYNLGTTIFNPFIKFNDIKILSADKSAYNKYK